MTKGENSGAGARSGCDSQGCVGLAVWIGNRSGFGGRRGLHGNVRRISGDAGFRFFFDTYQALIGNLPSEVAVLAALLEMLLKEDGTTGIRNENAGSGQKNIASAVLHFHTTPEKG